jgi:hypothetical protein
MEVKQPEREADRSPPSSAEVKNEWNYNPLSHTSSWRGKGKKVKLSLC